MAHVLNTLYGVLYCARDLGTELLHGPNWALHSSDSLQMLILLKKTPCMASRIPSRMGSNMLHPSWLLAQLAALKHFRFSHLASVGVGLGAGTTASADSLS